MLYSWAVENPSSVACIAGIYPACDLSSYPTLGVACKAYEMTAAQLAAKLLEHNPIDRIAPLAKAGVPIFHIHGDEDTAVPFESNAVDETECCLAVTGNLNRPLIRHVDALCNPDFDRLFGEICIGQGIL